MASELSDDELGMCDPTLVNLLEQTSLKWIFVGGKGGVGKTTTSCSLAVQLAARRSSVLVVSTDPAHNLSDAFGQKFSRKPTPVDGFDNLFCMEIDPKADAEEMTEAAAAAETASAGGADGGLGGIGSMLKEFSSSIPGIDEAMSFAELMKHVQSMEYETIVFDTAPTGHTLRLLSFPKLMDGALGKIMDLKDKFSGMLGGILGGGQQEAMLGKLDELRAVVDRVSAMFKDPDLTTFVCVCIPEFLSLYETERLVQELTNFEIDVRNVVVNQVLFPEPGTQCRRCLARQAMQGKYLDQIEDLYEDFHVVHTPLLDEEVRGAERLGLFGQHLMVPYVVPDAPGGGGDRKHDDGAGGAGGGAS